MDKKWMQAPGDKEAANKLTAEEERREAVEEASMFVCL